MNVPILTYHSWVTRSAEYDGNDHVALASDLEFLKREGIRIVPLNEIVDALLAGRLDDCAGCIGLSFDDGARLDFEDVEHPAFGTQRSFYRLLTAFAEDRSAQASSFVVASPEAMTRMDRERLEGRGWLNDKWWAAATASGLIKIENHGWEHDSLSGDASDDRYQAADAQIRRAAERIGRVCGLPTKFFAYPYGVPSDYLVERYLPDHFTEHRVKAAFTNDARPVSNGCNRWLVPRFTCGADWNSPRGLERLLRDSMGKRPAERRAREDTPVSRYQPVWDQRAASAASALASVDGSGSEEVVRLTGAWAAEQVSAALDLKAHERVVELGCGVGRIGRELAPSCGQWAGTDISQNMLRAARDRMAHLSNTQFQWLQRSSLEMFPDEQFDKAYSVAVLCHMDKEDVYLYLEELARTLKPGGVAYFETWNLAHPVGWKRWEFELKHWSVSGHAGARDVARNQFSVPEEVQLFTRRAGFEVAACYADSPWIQMIATKPGGDESGFRRYLRDHCGAIANNEEWTELFSRKLDVDYGRTHPRDMLAWLHRQPPGRNIDLYRRYMQALWRANPRRWGAVDEGD